MELFPFLMPRLLRNLFQGHFVSCASFYTKYARQHTRTEDFLFFLFCQDEKLSSPRKRIWWPTVYISCISSEKLEKIFPKFISDEIKLISSFLTINGYKSLKGRRKYWQPYAYGWQLSNEWILGYFFSFSTFIEHKTKRHTRPACYQIVIKYL